MWDFGYLIISAVVLIGSFLWAGYATKRKGLIIFGYTFAVIMVTVFVAEGISYFWNPEHITISNSFREFMGDHPLYGWFLLTAWVAFAWSLAVHLASPRKGLK